MPHIKVKPRYYLEPEGGNNAPKNLIKIQLFIPPRQIIDCIYLQII